MKNISKTQIKSERNGVIVQGYWYTENNSVIVEGFVGETPFNKSALLGGHAATPGLLAKRLLEEVLSSQ